MAAFSGDLGRYACRSAALRSNILMFVVFWWCFFKGSVMRLGACAVGNGFDGSGATPRGNESEPMIKTRGHERPRSTPPRTPPLLLTHLDPAEEILVCLISFFYSAAK